MTNNRKKYEKARKHLINARESLEFWREVYVNNERDNNPSMDLKFHSIGATIREDKRKDILNCIKDAKERIAKFERIVY